MSLAVVVLSGGMDSTAALALYADRGHELLAVSVNYGQRHAQRELTAAAEVAGFYDARHVVLDLTSYGYQLGGSALTDPDVDVPDGHYADDTMRATVVPNRNTVLASLAVGLAVANGAEVVVLGIHAGDHAVYPDCRPEFLTALQQLVAVANEGFSPPRIDAPFLELSKTDVASIGSGLGAPFRLTWSCYKGGVAHCGTCGTCVERQEAFRDAGVPDPTVYLGNTRAGVRA